MTKQRRPPLRCPTPIRQAGVFLLATGLFLPSPAFALRNLQPVQNSGLEEEIANALKGPAPPATGLEERLRVDEGGGETLQVVTDLISWGARSVHYLGGLEEAQRFERIAHRALIDTVYVGLEEIPLPELIGQILTGLGYRPEVITTGLEEFTAYLESVASGA